MTTTHDIDVTSAFTAARRRQEVMLEEVRHRLSGVVAELEDNRGEALRREQEAAALEVRSTMPETEPAAAASAHRRRKECLSRLSALDERHAQLHALEQRLRCLERDIRERVELAGRVTGILAEARSDRTIAVLVDRALARCEGTALEDDEYETDF